MAVLLSPVGGVAGQFFDNNGNPLTGGKLYSYVAGTTTPQATYTSSAGTVAHANPIILDAGGRVPGGEIWLTDGLQYKFVLKNANDVLIGTYDNIVGINSNFVNFLTETEVQTATAGQTVFTLTTMQYQQGTNNLSVFVDGVNQIDGSTYSYVETSSTVVTFTAGLHVGALVKFTTAQTLSTGVTDASLVTYSPAGTGAVATTVQTKLREYVSVADFGAVGDGVTDDTIAINAAISYINSTDSLLYFPVTSGNYKITSALTTISSRGGVDMEAVAYDSTGKGSILVSGTGYTGVTVTGSPARFKISIVGTGQVANALLLQNPILSNFEVIRVNNFNGFGVKINKCWDSLFGTISVELCGNASEYAFSMNDDGDTCNMSHITRLQVETSKTHAISISANTLSCVIDNIHSEGAIPTAGVNTWTIGGNRCTYNNARFNSGATVTDSSFLIAGNNNTIVNLFTEGAIPVVWDSGTSNTNTLVTPEILGNLSENSGQSGTLVIDGGYVVSYSGSLLRYRRFGVKGMASISFTPVLNFGGVATAATGTISGEWSVVGNIVKFSLLMALTGKGAATGAATITGLPFSLPASGPDMRFLLIGENINCTGPLSAYLGNSANFLALQQIASFGAGATNLTDLQIFSNAVIRLSGEYTLGA